MISEEEKLKNIDRVYKLVSTFPTDRRDRVTQMLQKEEQFFLAPASSQEGFHSAYPGGLCQHSLNVVAALWQLQSALCPDKWPKHRLAFVGLFHDFGKIGVDGVPRYVPNENDWQRREWGKIYKVNPKLRFMTINDATSYNLQKYGIALDSEEWISLRMADGQYDAANKDYAMREPQLGLLLHWADLHASNEEKALGQNS
jgi:hypothetical protein